MDYHSDRFPDHSLIFTRAGKIFALLPARPRQSAGLASRPYIWRLNHKFKSHSSGSSGSLFSIKTIPAAERFLSFIYKPCLYLPHHACDEPLCIIPDRRCSSFSERVINIDQNNRTKFRNIRKAGIRKAVKAGLIIEETLTSPPSGKYLTPISLTDRSEGCSLS